ncbi:MAG: catechol 2,3-dioxygenase-like lactoylglutathione lyase family enzyme [Phycisphaerales bacterium]|jgi:catechol 2,3-dioxygenase-like lactoylglutathione lyase family enzyme
MPDTPSPIPSDGPSDARRADPPPLHAIHETVLYAVDLAAAERFYRDVLGLEQIIEGSELMIGFRVTPKPGQVLLIFNPEVSSVPGRPVPSHGCRGDGHLALRISPEDEPTWITHLESHGVEIERVTEWDSNRGRSIYVRDPAGNSVELINADIWARIGAGRLGSV